jgi:hypothetical protein
LGIFDLSPGEEAFVIKGKDTFDTHFFPKRSILEPVNDQLKAIGNLEHSRPRSFARYWTRSVASLAADAHQDKNRLFNGLKPIDCHVSRWLKPDRG